MIKFGLLLKKLRDDSGFPQIYVANYVGVVGRTMGNWEIGETSPTLENLKMIAQFYKMKVADLVYLSGLSIDEICR